jgi:hypothetical protein
MAAAKQKDEHEHWHWNADQPEQQITAAAASLPDFFFENFHVFGRKLRAFGKAKAMRRFEHRFGSSALLACLACSGFAGEAP